MLAIGMDGKAIDHPWGTMELAHHHPLGTVNNECPLWGHEGYLPKIYFFFFDLLYLPASARLFLSYYQPESCFKG